MSWPDAAPQAGPTSWPDAAPQAGSPSRTDAAPQDVPMSWPEAAPLGGPAAPDPAVPDPVPAWAQPPSPAPGAWSNLSTPAPWPHGERGRSAEAPDQRAAAYGQTAPAGPPPHDAPAAP
ncbi:hypothetical protein ETD86_50465, partial [Nonomuraea turkmeniaca]